MPIKVITSPNVYLVGAQYCNDGPRGDLVNFLDDHGVGEWMTDVDADAGEKLSEVAGRVCYMSFKSPRPGGNKAYLQHILESGHGSVLEHAVWNFIFTGVSRSLSHELVRHRAGWAYSQLSQRYVDESDVAFVCPPRLLAGYGPSRNENRVTPENVEEVLDYRAWEDSCALSQKAYVDLVRRLTARAEYAGQDKAAVRKAVRETARSVLPNATETKVFCTANARAVRHFLEMRCSRQADAEIRRLAGKVWEVMVEEAPNLFGDYVKADLPDGSFELTTLYRKV